MLDSIKLTLNYIFWRKNVNILSFYAALKWKLIHNVTKFVNHKWFYKCIWIICYNIQWNLIEFEILMTKVLTSNDGYFECKGVSHKIIYKAKNIYFQYVSSKHMTCNHVIALKQTKYMFY